MFEAPARFATTSACSTSERSNDPDGGSHEVSSGAWASRRTSVTTWCPCVRRAPHQARPRKPEAPAIRNCICSPSHLEAAGLEALLDLGQEAGGVGSVHQPVVVGQREVDHLPDRD